MEFVRCAELAAFKIVGFRDFFFHLSVNERKRSSCPIKSPQSLCEALESTFDTHDAESIESIRFAVLLRQNWDEVKGDFFYHCIWRKFFPLVMRRRNLAIRLRPFFRWIIHFVRWILFPFHVGSAFESPIGKCPFEFIARTFNPFLVPRFVIGPTDRWKVRPSDSLEWKKEKPS